MPRNNDYGLRGLLEEKKMYTVKIYSICTIIFHRRLGWVLVVQRMCLKIGGPWIEPHLENSFGGTQIECYLNNYFLAWKSLYNKVSNA